MNAGGGDLVGAWYELGRSLVTGRPVDAASGWPVLTTREAFELARSWALVLMRMGDAVEPIAARWIDESRALLAESVGPDELLPSSGALWEVGAALLGSLTRNAFDPSVEIRVSFDANKRLLVSNVNSPLLLDLALRRFFVAQGRTEKRSEKNGRAYVEISVGEAQQVVELWRKYVAQAKPLDNFRDPRDELREWAGRAATAMEGKGPDELYPVGEAEELWAGQRRIGNTLAVLKDNQPPKGWAAYADAAKATVKAMASDLLDGASDAASTVGGAVADAGGAAIGGVKDAAKAVERGVSGILKPLAIGAGILGAGVLAVVLVKK